MRRLTPRYRRWMRNRIRHEGRKRFSHRRVTFATITSLTGERTVRLGAGGESPPENFCFDENLEGTLTFIAALRKRSRILVRGGMSWPSGKHQGQRLGYLTRYYDFARLRRISPSAALVLAAEYDLRRRIGGRNPFAVRLQEWTPEVRDLLRELGFFNLLEIEQNVPPSSDPSRMILRFRSGSTVNPTEVGGPDSVLGSLFAFIGENPQMETRLYSAVIEAMNNVRDHAYPEHLFYGVRHVKDWWLTGAADRTTRRLTLSLYDQGITIPVSLPNTWGLGQLIGTFLERFQVEYDPEDSAFDRRAIEAAMVTAKSSTGLGHRGLGLAKIREVVDSLPGGKLRIISRRGEYIVSSGGPPRSRTCNVPLEGTLVEIEASF